MKICSSCGASNADNSKFCETCGTPLAEAAAPEAPASEEPAAAPEPAPAAAVPAAAPAASDYQQQSQAPKSDYYEEPKAHRAGNANGIEERNIGLAILFSFLTCGIYMLYWHYKMSEEFRQLTGDTSLPEGGMTISEAMLKFEKAMEGLPEEDVRGHSSPNNLNVMRILPGTERFRSLVVSDYIKDIREKEDLQFSAVTFDLPDGRKMVTFRGTDNTMVAWKEDLLLTVLDEIPSQRDALSYLMRQCEKSSCPIILAGHSKGGNLAEYAAMMIPEEYQNRITDIYNFDGPGFYKDLNDDERFARIRSRIHKYTSQNSIVGRLLIESADTIIVHTEESGWRAHDGFNWEVQRTSFARDDDYSLVSNALQSGFNGTVESVPFENRREFIDDLFDTLYENDVHFLSDLNRKKLQEMSSESPEFFKNAGVGTLISLVSKAYLQETMSSVASALPPAPALPKLSRRKFSRLRIKKADAEEDTPEELTAEETEKTEEKEETE